MMWRSSAGRVASVGGVSNDIVRFWMLTVEILVLVEAFQVEVDAVSRDSRRQKGCYLSGGESSSKKPFRRTCWDAKAGICCRLSTPCWLIAGCCVYWRGAKHGKLLLDIHSSLFDGRVVRLV